MRALIVLCLFALLAWLTSPVLAEVYKRVNPDGSVEFSDVPSSKKDQPVDLPPPSTFEAPQLSPPSPPRVDPNASNFAYTSLSIVSPANEATLRNNAGNIEVSAALTPALQPGHKLVLLLDGNRQGEASGNTFKLTNLDRGSHQLTVEVRDADGKTLIASPSVTIYLHRHSILFNPNKTPAQGKPKP
jgi:hypothetical protein